jgi:hypothetical protein
VSVDVVVVAVVGKACTVFGGVRIDSLLKESLMVAWAY